MLFRSGNDRFLLKHMADNENQTDGGMQNSAPREQGGESGANAQINAYAIDRLSQTFETSAKRWELIVYPSLFAFIILAAYGFYLVFSLAKDVHYLAISVDSNDGVGEQHAVDF